jgi:N-acetylgalactosamine-6-sulfatase
MTKAAARFGLGWLALVGALAVVAAPRPVEAAEPKQITRPNIVLIIADDLGYGDLACYGCPDTRTPALDRLAAQGVRFTNFYANAPECTPTRTALMTGRYQQHVGGLECAIGTGNVGRYDDAVRLAERHDLGLPVSETTILELLKRAGYTLGGFGKWHLGYEPKFMPLEHGFDRFFGPMGGGVDYWYHGEWDGVHMLYENDRPVHCEGYLTDLVTDKALEFLREETSGRKRGEPFFLYLPYTAPHTPIQHPDRKPPAPRLQETWNRGDRETYVLMVERLDRCIGKVLDALDRRAIAENTLVIFFSDNGGTKTANNGPFSGTKGGLFEGGIREPCIVRWPGVLPEGKVTDQMAITFDLSKSIVRAAGAELPQDRPFEGIDVLEHLEEGRPPQPRTLFWRHRRGERTWRAVRDGPLKYLSRQDGDRFNEYLFDLEADPGEKNDLLASRPDDVKRLKQRLADWEEEVRPSR